MTDDTNKEAGNAVAPKLSVVPANDIPEAVAPVVTEVFLIKCATREGEVFTLQTPTSKGAVDMAERLVAKGSYTMQIGNEVQVYSVVGANVSGPYQKTTTPIVEEAVNGGTIKRENGQPVGPSDHDAPEASIGDESTVEPEVWEGNAGGVEYTDVGEGQESTSEEEVQGDDTPADSDD